MNTATKIILLGVFLFAAEASQGFNNTFFIEEGEKEELIKKLSKIKF